MTLRSRTQKIIKVLEHASSSYLPGFLDFKKKIQNGYELAQENLRFLETLN